MRPTDVSPFIGAISAIRLSNYRSYFSTVDDQDLYACYQWNGELSRSFLPLIHLVEVTLRNAYHKALSAYYSQAHTGVMSDSYRWYLHTNFAWGSQKTLEKAAGGKLNLPSSKPDDVVSKQTFGFWTNILAEPSTPWGTVLPNVFPNTTKSWSLGKHRDSLTCRKRLINDLRNRISHWEPVWKQSDLMEERILRPGSAPLRVYAPATTNPSQSISRLMLIHDRTVSFLEMMNLDLANAYKDSYSHEHFVWVCSEAGLESFRGYERRKEMSMTNAKRSFSSIMASKSILTINNGKTRVRIQPLG